MDKKKFTSEIDEITRRLSVLAYEVTGLDKNKRADEPKSGITILFKL